MLISMLAAPQIRATTLAPAAPQRRPLDPVALGFLARGLMLVLLPVTLALAGIDPRQLNGASVWSKPIKFQLSLFVHFATLTWLAALLDPAAAAGPWLRRGFLAAVVAAFGEVLYITLQAARGRASHFNLETPLEAALYNAMGVGALLIVLNAMQLGWVLRRGARAETGEGLCLGAVLGLILGGAATLVVAGALGSGELVADKGHWVGGIRSDSGGLPLFGWSQSGGDLRVPHFFATHLMQALPLLGLLADRYWQRRARFVVLAGALLGLGLVGFTFAQAIRGQPLLTL
ncbi:hypothetical protein A8950_2134 [Dongia mobilis]|uniref:Uncharacterized protein n=1 Tax=Dongia mobilis TaxID=578943 RepID=A0A4R6WMT8_9PROT|nr:hypothetical protein [Dongia mobilis]TDQ82312.1 hypothetical protein A8950_2134 [Dongia mobilis]